MWNNYVYPVHDFATGDLVIKSVKAPSLDQAEDKIMEQYSSKYPAVDSDDWKTFVKQLDAIYDVAVGEIYDIEEL